MQLIVATIVVSLSCTFATPRRNAYAKLENSEIPLEAQLLTGNALVDYINKNQNLFKAEIPASINELKMKIMKPKYVNWSRTPRVDQAEDIDHYIPASFDARTKWSHCPSIGCIRDQSDCGSCWAVSSAEAMSDRVCIASSGNTKVELSADDIMSCCYYCGYGCEGGWPSAAWDYFVRTGVVTGGLYGTEDACRPYEISPCGVHRNQTFYRNCTGEVDTPTCKTKCQAGYPVPYKDDKTYGKISYNVTGTARMIQMELMTHGPVVAAFIVFEDFMYYRSGIYQHVGGGMLGGHAVKIIGWGEENGVPYWLIANSWNTDWGEDGYFRMRRGTDECGIEENVFAGQV